jgi:16S rRNA (guanine966-N2)-methyltransferase
MIVRLSGGAMRGRRLAVPRGATLRPTPGRVKEALFSILGERVPEARVLDLFAGTGAIGFEALSRGAARVTFVESHAPMAAAIRETAETLGLTARVHIVRDAAERAVRRLRERFDIIYVDPPYALPPPDEALNVLRAAGALDSATVVVYEHRSGAPPFTFSNFTTEREAHYGEATLQFLRAVELLSGL